ncbi:hypothetical protein SAMN02744133_102490 [Thalassospira xiamenensis M-5 = DSM 17429]|uniref:Secreted protein n=1 Tax=Thalassospira xiamenensis M-5 = DSM 17429 TaxID=1123366 RepID=A0AB72U7V1_9PROT|nr:hypothetical protein [Thalassospira xiamenensis]AJD50305.1 secreted protein [Thalassospira xiamenensis M-5 = DSM 17429]SIS81606.1 hypothetical protein SAMN02744133_102490 [Thalassospira xiamenensis M-5 = DSM 17429]
MNKRTLWCLLLSSCLVSPALAQLAQQETTSSQVEPGIEEMVRKVNIVTRAKTRTAVSENEPMAIDLGLVDVPGAPPKLTEGVTAKAYARYVNYEDSLIAQLVLTGVEKDGRSEPLDSNDFVAQFNMDSPELDPASPVTIEGNQETLIAALQRLNAVEEDDKEEKETETAEADTGASNTVGSNASKNADAAGYSTPAALDVEEDTGTPTVRVTTEGCNIRVDLAQLVAVQQSRVETTEDGNVTSGTCEDGADRYPLDRSYSVCGDTIDMETRQATAQYLLYYTDGGGNRQEVTDCLKDEDKVFDITEKTSACSVYLDYNEMMAVPQASLVYVNASNNEVQVRSCEPSEEIAPVPLISVTDGCSIRHDFAAGRSYQTGRHIYELNGTTWQADACSDNGTEYPHETVYKNAAGQEVCAPIINQAAGTVTRQSRKQIVVNGVEQFITECKPDSANIAIQSTIDGCDNPSLWNHDLAAGASYGRERFYYLLDGIPQYVTQCQDSEIAYPHHVETTGWQTHDDQLFAYRLTTVYIEGTPKGRFNIKTSEVLPGEPQTAYIYSGESPATNGEHYYEGCTRFDARDLMQSYERPDGSIHKVVIGDASPLNLGDKCTQQVVWSEVTTRSYSSDGQRSGGPCGTSSYSTTVGSNDSPWSDTRNMNCTWSRSSATKTIVREDGVAIGDSVTRLCETAPNSYPYIVGYFSYKPLSKYNYSFPAHTNAVKTNCMGSWGWW